MNLDTQTVAKKSRAQEIRDMVDIRLATNPGDGQLIAALLKENGIELAHADWSVSLPNWLLATVDTHVIGCVEVLIGRPAGFLEFLQVHPDAPFKLRAIAIRKLLLQGMATLRLAGAQYLGGTPAKANVKFVNVLSNMNFVPLTDCTLMVKRLTLDS